MSNNVSKKNDDIFRGFRSPDRTTHSAPTGGNVGSSRSTPQLPPASLVQKQSDGAAAAAAASCADYIAASPSERSRHAAEFSSEQRSTMARFGYSSGGASSSSGGTATSPASAAMMMNVLLTRDRSKTSALVAELRREAHFMQKAEQLLRAKEAAATSDSSSPLAGEGAAAAAAAASSKRSSHDDDDDDEHLSSPLGGAATDVSQMDRFANLASQSAARQTHIAQQQLAQEKLARAMYQEEREQQQQQEAAAAAAIALERQQQREAEEQRRAQDGHEEEQEHGADEKREASAGNQHVWKPEALQRESARSDDDGEVKDGAATTSILQHLSKRKVTFSNLPTGAPKMSFRDAAVRLQRQIRRYIACAAAQRLAGLERLQRHAGRDALLCCSFPTGSVCTCSTTARWLVAKDDEGSSQQQQLVLSCSTGIGSAPYHLQCLAAAALEYEVRVHSENLSQWYIHEGEHGSSHGRGHQEVPRLSEDEKRLLRQQRAGGGGAGARTSSTSSSSSDEDGNDHGESANAADQDAAAQRQRQRRKQEKRWLKRKPTLPERFQVLRKGGLPRHDVEEVLSMLHTALAAARYAVSKKGEEDSSSSHHHHHIDHQQATAADAEKENLLKQQQQAHETEKKATTTTITSTASADPSVLQLAAQWVHDSLAPFAHLSMCSLFGGSVTHESGLELLVRNSVVTDKKGGTLDCYSLGGGTAPSFFDKDSKKKSAQREEKEEEEELQLLQHVSTAGRGFDAARKTLAAASSERRRVGDRNYRAAIAPRIFFISMPQQQKSASASSSSFINNSSNLLEKDAVERIQMLQKMQWESGDSTSSSKKAKDVYSLLTAAPMSKTRSDDDALASTNQINDGEPNNDTEEGKVGAVAVVEEETRRQEEKEGDDFEQQLPPCPPLSEDEKALLQEMGEEDPTVGEMLRQIQEGDDEEYAASVADIERRLAVVKAVHKSSVRELGRATAVSCGTGGDEEEEEAQKKAMDNTTGDAVRRSVLVKTTKQQPKNDVNRTCVICELDEIGTHHCRCGNFFHHECGIATSPAVVFCCSVCAAVNKQ